MRCARISIFFYVAFLGSALCAEIHQSCRPVSESLVPSQLRDAIQQLRPATILACKRDGYDTLSYAAVSKVTMSADGVCQFSRTLLTTDFKAKTEYMSFGDHGCPSTDSERYVLADMISSSEFSDIMIFLTRMIDRPDKSISATLPSHSRNAQEFQKFAIFLRHQAPRPSRIDAREEFMGFCKIFDAELISSRGMPVSLYTVSLHRCFLGHLEIAGIYETYP
jgi:hypothetical protein